MTYPYIDNPERLGTHTTPTASYSCVCITIYTVDIKVLFVIVSQGSEASYGGIGGSDGGQGMGEAQMVHLPAVFRDHGASRVSRVQDILLFLQSPQMDVAEYRVRPLIWAGFEHEDISP